MFCGTTRTDWKAWLSLFFEPPERRCNQLAGHRDPSSSFRNWSTESSSSSSIVVSNPAFVRFRGLTIYAFPKLFSRQSLIVQRFEHCTKIFFLFIQFFLTVSKSLNKTGKIVYPYDIIYCGERSINFERVLFLHKRYIFLTITSATTIGVILNCANDYLINYSRAQI